MDVVITTAQVPGRKPPVLVTVDAVAKMALRFGHRRHGRLRPRRQLRTESGRGDHREPNGVTIIAPENLPASMPAGASAFYARNISNLLLGMVKDGALHLDFEDEVTKSTVVSQGGDHAVRAVSESARTGHPGRWRSRVSQELLNSLAIFVLAILVGFEVISKVPATLHTPLMSGANSIHGIVLVGAMFIAVRSGQPVRLRPRVRRDGVRGDERRRRLRGHRSDAADVPQEADGRQGRVRGRVGRSRGLVEEHVDV